MFSFSAIFRRRGPLYDGRAERAAEDARREIEQTLAEVGAHKTELWFSRFARTQTPYYRTRITAKRDGPGWEVTDQGVVYGPWLAGTGSRNRTTRFKGYPHWTLAREELDAQTEDIAQFVLARYLPRMGGR